MTFSMRWGMDGKPRLSKHAPDALRKLVEAGHFNQNPPPAYSRPRKRPEQFIQCRRSLVPPAGSNPYGVTKGEIWVDGDKRNADHRGPLRRVKVLTVGDTHAVVVNLTSGYRSAIKLANFSGKPRKLSRQEQTHD